MITDPAELEAVLVPVLKRNGSEIPPKGCYIAAVEFDEAGEVLAYQLLQNAIFLEGLWARDNSAHLLTLYRMAETYLVETLKADRWLTLTRADETGNRIGKLAKRLGFKQMDWLIFRRQR
jgi:hypothetical protein